MLFRSPQRPVGAGCTPSQSPAAWLGCGADWRQRQGWGRGWSWGWSWVRRRPIGPLQRHCLLQRLDWGRGHLGQRAVLHRSTHRALREKNEQNEANLGTPRLPVDPHMAHPVAMASLSGCQRIDRRLLKLESPINRALRARPAGVGRFITTWPCHGLSRTRGTGPCSTRCGW